MKEKVYIIILNWNHHEDTIECLESVFLNEYCNYQVIVCDNASTDNSMEKIRKWADGYHNIGIKYYLYTQSDIKKIDFRNEEDVPLILIENEKNLGYAGGNNIGIQYTMGKNDFSYIWILNNDTVVEKWH